MKTIFYIPRTDTDPDLDTDYWFNNEPHKEWFTLECVLYDPISNISIKIKNDIYLDDVRITNTIDVFSTTGIIRRISLRFS